ncbi:MAG: CHASE2 domain-containing protein [Myxococcales bacterium]|nr:adenylate/guanylate cyclase domain-containing protein [Myxococcales bacterium]
MQLWRWLKRVNAFRIGLFTGLLFAALQVVEIAGRAEVPLLTKMEKALVDLRFKQRVELKAQPTTGRIVVAAVDEAAIAKFGRFPWDRRVMASLIDKLNEQSVTAIGFDMSFSDEDLGARFAGAKRYRKRFEDISLASPRNRSAVEHFGEAESDIAGAASALQGLSRKLGNDPVYQAARGRLDDGHQKLADSRKTFEDLVKQHEEYAAELDHDLTGADPDELMGDAVARAAAKTVIGWVALTQGEMTLSDVEAEEHAKRIERSQIHTPEFREPLVDGGERVVPVPKTWVKEYAGLRAPLLPIGKGAQWFGYFNALPDADGVIRHAALALQVRGRYFPSLDAALTAIALGLKPSDITPVTTNTTDGEILGVDFGGKRFVQTDARGLMEINYFGRDKTFENLSIADIMDGKYDGKLKDKLVLIGATAQGTFDERTTPLDKFTAGIETHANAVETILSQRYLRRGPIVQAIEVLFLFAMALVFAYVFARVKVQYALPVVAVSGLTIWIYVSAAFWSGYDFFAALPLVELGAMFVLVTVYRYATEERDKRQLRKAFQLYLNEEVLEEMLEDPAALQLGGKDAEATVLFADIRGFTTISEQLSPQAVVHLMNEIFSPMTDNIFEKRGTLDKYIGDCVMAFFGAPVQTELHGANGCDAALSMVETLARLREKWHIEDPDMPDVDVGIGINSGHLVVGNMGSHQRFNYTVMGDNVNLASRIESLNKEYGTRILISEQTLGTARKALKDDAAYTVRELDSVRVKGKKEPVKLFELRRRGPTTTEEMPLLNGYAEALDLYRRQKFGEAGVLFESLLTRFPGDGPCTLFVRRCEMMMQNPPGREWDGVFKMEHK